MHLHIHSVHDHTVVSIAGELDLTTHEHLRDAFTCLRLWGYPVVEVDLGLVTFIDIGSLRILHEEQQRHEQLQRSFAIVDASRTFELVARISGYGCLLPHRRSARTPRSGAGQL